MRSERIKIKDESLASRTRLYHFLYSINEPIYKHTSLLHIKQDYTAFCYNDDNWSSIDGLATISIDDFIAKYSPKSKPTAKPKIYKNNKYKNTNGKICTITEVNEHRVTYLHENGSIYTCGIDLINFWTKLPKTKEATPMIIKNLPPGTKVRVRDDLKEYKTYSMNNNTISDSVNTSMLKYRGTIVTIKGPTPHSSKYLIKEDQGGYSWTDEMFSEIVTTPNEPITHKFKVGDVVKFKPGIKSGDIFNDTTIMIVENMDTVTLSVSQLGKEPHFKDNVMLSNGFWYGIDALELANPITIKEPSKTKASKSNTLTKFKEPVAQPEPIKSTTTTKEETFMSKLKATALVTVDKNKEAAAIAAKMEAGRIINKQVIKQAAKHVPFWAKGYLDTPLAPVILANAVAMLGNHTGNTKVQKVSELMLLAAADVTVQSFNLDQIIDDILAGIKLPAGILDDNE